MASFNRIFILLLFLVCTGFQSISAKDYTFSGRILQNKGKTPVEFATVYLPQNTLWAITNEKGEFTINNVPEGKIQVKVQCLGFADNEFELKVNKDISDYVIRLDEDNLSLEEVVVTAQKLKNDQTSSYLLDNKALEHAQIVNVSNVTALLPGGKSMNDANLATNDDRITVHGGSNEMGNASFGTAINIDGVRLDNNSSMSETKGSGVRNLSSSSIESIEIITGIPSVEYGDLSSGMVKINTRKGKTPWMIEFTTEPRTKQIALNKGFKLSDKGGTLNAGLERTKSTANIASPHTSYQRNVLTLNYSNSFSRNPKRPINMTAGFTGNLGGYNSEADPDAFKDTYTKQRDYAFRGHVNLNWLANLSWLTNLSFTASANYADKLHKVNTNKNSASTQPLIHTIDQGYFIATSYDEHPDANIILGPTGYWYELQYNDQRPLTFNTKIKGNWSKIWNGYSNNILLGAEWNSSRNNGRGVYYDDMRYAPTWREYRYDELPSLNNFAVYLEEKFSKEFNNGGKLDLTGGLRTDISYIRDSEYGTVASFSPRINAKYTFFRNKKWFIKDLSIYAGTGKAVKLPSFEVLYPSPSYADKLAFAPGTMADGTTFYAYYTQPSKAIYNPELKWQYTHQSEVGIEADTRWARISVSGYYNVTHNPYMRMNVFRPYSYEQTTQHDLEGCPIPSANRQYFIDQQTGKVTVTDKTGMQGDVLLSSKERKTFYSNAMYTNASSIKRAGLDWIIDFKQIPAIRTSFRVDGNYYHYKGLDETLIAAMPSGSANMSNGEPYQYVGYYKGANATSSSFSANASVSNGKLSEEVNLNLTVTTHIPKVRLIVSMRFESSLYNYTQNLSEYSDGTHRGMALESNGDFFSNDYDIYGRSKYVAIYPEFYSTWDDPNTKIPFAEKLAWAKTNDKTLYNELVKLVVKSNNDYYFNPNKITAYFAANLNITKEIGKYASVSFFAKNFFNNAQKVTSSQTGLQTSVYDSGYIPRFYYGLNIKLKL